MDTMMDLSARGGQAEQALEKVETELRRLEKLLSRTRSGSAIWEVNQANGQACLVGEEVCGLLKEARHYHDLSGGAFDPTLAAVSDAWGFTKERQRVPSPRELTALLAQSGMDQVQIQEGGILQLEPGVQLDLGGIAKGYAADRAAAIFRRCRVTSGTLSLGGNLWVCGEKEPGVPWRVGIQDPWRVGEMDGYVGTLDLSDAFAVTSGGYQRFFEENGKRYHHILDPKTGMPAESGLLSVTIVSTESGTLCDALSTALFVLGEEQALDLWRELEGAFQAVLVTEDGRVLVTAGLESVFQEAEGSGYQYEMVS